MVARCSRTFSLGVVTCTTGRAVGSAVSYAEEGVGAVATQATTNVYHGPNALWLLREGFNPSQVLESTLALDDHPEFRQVLIIDSEGRTSAHTGVSNTDWKGHIQGGDYVAGGNNIVGEWVLEAMVDSFEATRELPLHERLLRVVEEGEEAGGCNIPDHTAALLVVGIEEDLKIYSRPVLDLRVDSSENPTQELREVYESYREFIKERRGWGRRSIEGFE
jgi:uncharacterized Ntn-hydrolase superfamily protein